MSNFFEENPVICSSFNDTVKNLNSILNIDLSFDLIYKLVKIGGRKASIYFIDGFVKDDIMQMLQMFFYDISSDEMSKDAHDFSIRHLPYVETEISGDRNKIVTNILSGVICLVIEGYTKCILIDCRTYPQRTVDEPDKEKVLRGSKDGFVEILVNNVALIRRRIRSTEFTVEMLNAGETSKTDIVVCYMKDRVDTKLLEKIKYIVNTIKIDALTMNQESLAECLYKSKWYNPFPKFKYTERPDTAAATILEGKIAIIVDNSPSAILLPTTIFDVMDVADDYYFPPITGTYLRLTRFIITLVALFITPSFLLLQSNPQWIPQWLEFIIITDDINIPLIFQLLILEISIDGLKLAAVNTPNMLSTPLSVIAGIVIGESAVKSGWFNSEIMLYMAFVAIANFTHASYELGYALKFMRIVLMSLTAIFGLYGFIAGVLIIIFTIVLNKTISGESYIYPLIPWNGKKVLNIIFRLDLLTEEKQKK